ncbi:hypothetical protein PUG46_19380 [Erwiniaceae bacterium L1_55_4]|nr:hypothetical protein [Erwiniaceae bacterium L1_55_4]
MANPLTLGFSALSGKIYAGRSKPIKGAAPGVRQFTGEKVDVTDDALGCVADKLLKEGKPVQWDLGDGRILTLTAEIINPY